MIAAHWKLIGTMVGYAAALLVELMFHELGWMDWILRSAALGIGSEEIFLAMVRETVEGIIVGVGIGLGTYYAPANKAPGGS